MIHYKIHINHDQTQLKMKVTPILQTKLNVRILTNPFWLFPTRTIVAIHMDPIRLVVMTVPGTSYVSI